MVVATRRSRSIAVETKMLVALNLRGSCGQQVDVHPRRATITVVTSIRPQIGTQLASVIGEGLWRGDVGRADLRNGGRPRDGLAGRRHHGTGIIDDGVVAAAAAAAILTGSSGGGSCSKVLGLVTASRVGVIVDS